MEKGRFAPSPSGRMHLGNLFAALLAWLSAKSTGGGLVLRMEDLDPERCRGEYTAQLVDDLNWLGLTWDEGYGAGGPAGPYLQSRRAYLYEAAFRKLEGQGLCYPCYCTRAERLDASAPHRSDGQAIYDGRCGGLSDKARRDYEAAGRRPAWRLTVPDRLVTFTDRRLGPYVENLKKDCGDFIIRRSDGVYAYQLAVVLDDAAMGVTQVVRGKDLLDSTPRQLFLYERLGLTPPAFYHVPLLLAPDGRRLSKRDKDMDMAYFRAHFTAEEVIGALAFLAGQLDRPAPITPTALTRIFSWEKVPKEDVVVPDNLIGPLASLRPCSKGEFCPPT